ncbi:MAG: DNA methyltransferase [Desulfobacteraceae bacterium IS3]|nr:MAG: DNA methyltransferase [Desulfobacteraceae bacterium IS3]
MIKKYISNLMTIYDVSLIEKHLIHIFITRNNLQYKDSEIISELLSEFNIHPQIYSQLSSLEIINLKQLENYLELLIPQEDRKLNGAFFTPNYIVDFIIKKTSPQEDERCLDPSCGSGAFLIGLVDYYKRTFDKSIKKTVQENIFGADILEYNIRRAKIILSLYGLFNDEIIQADDFNLYCADSLKAEWKSKYDIVVGNPPYIKFQDLSDENREYLKKNWKTIDNGTFNLYFAFFELGHKLLSPGGRLGYITPNNYFTSLAGLSLRQYFTQHKCLAEIFDFSHRKIFDAQTYTAVSFINKKLNDAILYDKINNEQNPDEFLIAAEGSKNYVKNLNVKKWRLLKTQEQQNIKTIETIGTPINQLFNIAVGIATLKDEVFFVDGSKEKKGLFFKETDKGMFFIEKDITKPVYKISNFKAQEEIEKNTLRIITPYHISGSSASPIPEVEFKDKYPYCYQFLMSEKQKLESRDKGKTVFKPFYVWGRTQGIARSGKKILSPSFSRHPRFLFVAEEDAYYTNGYGIYFSKDASENNSLFSEMVHPMSKEENILLVQKILNSVIMDYYVSKTSISIQGGFPCYQKNFIEKFTIPYFAAEEIDKLSELSDTNEIDKFLIFKYQLDIITEIFYCKQLKYCQQRVLN